jgi:hypothetical protein
VATDEKMMDSKSQGPIDRMLASKTDEIARTLERHTAILLFFDGKIDFDRFREQGSGVAVSLWGKHFLLTAGHCVKALEDKSNYLLMFPIKSCAHRRATEFRKLGFVADSGDLDVGYIELPETEKREAEAFSKVFLSSNRLQVISASELRREDERFIVTGYPAAYRKQIGSKGHSQGMEAVTTILAGTNGMPKNDADEIQAGRQVIDLWVSDSDFARMIGGEWVPATLPEFPGMSGGGCWRTCADPQVENWSEGKIHLIGTHAGSYRSEQLKEHRFAREILLGNHLLLIAKDYPDLRVHIFRAWPELQNWTIV